MQLLLRQRFFSWFDSFDIYDTEDDLIFTVKGRFSIGHCLEIYDAAGNFLGSVQEEAFSFLRRYTLYEGPQMRRIGQIRKEFTFFIPRFTLDCNDWQVDGDFLGWEYAVNAPGRTVMQISKQPFRLTDTYVLTIPREEDALLCLMIAISIDAAKCSDS